MLLADLGVDLKIGTWRVTIETGLDERAKPIASALGLGYMLRRVDNKEVVFGSSQREETSSNNLRGRRGTSHTLKEVAKVAC